MSLNARLLPKSLTRQWWQFLPYIASLGVFCFILWIGFESLTYPYDGITVLNLNGVVGAIDPATQAYSDLKAGDRIVSVDGLPWKDISSIPMKRAGETTELVVERDGRLMLTELTMVSPPRDTLLFRFIPLAVALLFLLMGVSIQAFKTSVGGADVLILWFIVCAMLLATGQASTLRPIWIAGLFTALVWLIGPLSVHFHLYFPQVSEIKSRRYWLPVLYGIGILGALPYLVLNPQDLQLTSWFSTFRLFSLLFLAFNLVIVAVLLINSYFHVNTPGARGKIRIVAFGGGMLAMLLVTLTILPDALLNQPIVPYSYAFLFLGLLPLTYGYAIFRYRLIEIEKHVNRAATYILVFSILGTLYLILYSVFSQWFPDSAFQLALVNTFIVLVLASTFFPLMRRVQRFVDTIFYGGWYDYRSAISQVSQGLEQITDLHSLAKTLSQRLLVTLRLQDTCVFLRDHDQEFSVIEVSTRGTPDEKPPFSFSKLPRSSLSFLLNIGAVERSSLRQALLETELSSEELQLLSSEQVNLWVPIIGHGQVLGLLALSQKIGGDIFSSEDMDILRVIARQTSPVIENIHLLNQLKSYAAELEERVKERTAELFNAKERAEAVLASVGDGVVVTDLHGNILTMNAAFEKQLAYNRLELEGKNLFGLMSALSEPAILEDLRATLANGDVWIGELVAERKGGAHYDVQLTIAPVCDQTGETISYVGSQRDFTRQKELDRLKDMFVADVSHELRTPTTNISLYLELLEDAPQERRKKYLEVVKEQSQLLSKLVEEILDLSRLAMARTKRIEFTAVDLNHLTERVITAHRPMAEDAGLQLSYTPSSEALWVRGEHNQLARVVTNLVSNAIRYTPHGEVCVQTFRENGRACLAVQDTGIGIEKDDKPHLFERFYRGRQVRQSKIHGTGLGLAIVKEIIDLHEGGIEVESEFGKGSTFTISLPVTNHDS